MYYYLNTSLIFYKSKLRVYIFKVLVWFDKLLRRNIERTKTKVPSRVWQKTWRHARPTTGQKTCHGQWQSGGLSGNGEGRMGNLVGGCVWQKRGDGSLCRHVPWRRPHAGKLICLLVPFRFVCGFSFLSTEIFH